MATPLEERVLEMSVLPVGVEPVAYTKAVRAAALPWNQRRERRDAASRSKLGRPAACLNMNHSLRWRCQVPHGKSSRDWRCFQFSGLTENVGVLIPPDATFEGALSQSAI